jgi:uncharacterized membrane protein
MHRHVQVPPLRSLARWSLDRSLPSVIAASTLSVAVLLLGPAMMRQAPTHRFLLWNLALAWVPLLGALAYERADHQSRRWWSVAALLTWLTFLPNAPYLVSDLTHLEVLSPTPWLDLARLFAFAFTGCVLCGASMRVVHRVVARRAGTGAGWATVLLATALCGPGVALGRFERLNSWQVVTRPFLVVESFYSLFTSRQALAVSGFFSCLALVSYLAFVGRGEMVRSEPST